jgi:hypothetical protein
MGRRLEVLLAPPVLGALALLLLNDFVLKSAFPGFVTGKLSDFAGLFVFAVFWMALFPRSRVAVAIGTGVAFVLWKSPAAEPVIATWNGVGMLTIGRVADPTDLVALIVLPIACLYHPRAPGSLARRWMLAPAAAAACVFAFGATSRIRPAIPVPNATYALDIPRVEVLRRIYDLRLSFDDPGVPAAAGDKGPDVVSLDIPPADTTGEPWLVRSRALSVDVEVDDARTGSKIRLVSVTAPPRGVGLDSVRTAFERLVVGRLRRNEPNTVHAPPIGQGRDNVFRPRVLSPGTLTETRGLVTVSLARQAHVAVIEVTPQERWHVIYPVFAEDERPLAPGTHTLVTSCATSPAAAAAYGPEQQVPVCGVARPVTPQDVAGRGARRAACGPAEEPPFYPVLRPGKLVVIAAERPLRRQAIEAVLGSGGRCAHELIGTDGWRPPAEVIIRRSWAGGGAWAASDLTLRR